MDFTQYVPPSGAAQYLRNFQGRILEGVQANPQQVSIMFAGNGIDEGIALIITNDGDHLHITGVERPVTHNTYGHKLYYPCERQRSAEPMKLFEPMLPAGDGRQN